MEDQEEHPHQVHHTLLPALQEEEEEGAGGGEESRASGWQSSKRSILTIHVSFL